MTTITSLPTDVLLTISKSISTNDIPSFVSTCSRLHSLTNHRSFWLSLLEAARSQRPISCSTSEELSLKDLDTLKQLTYHRLKLDRNWSKPFPQISGPVTAVMCNKPAEILSFIPGTDIALLHFSETSSVACWDLASGKPYKLDSIQLGDQVVAISQAFEDKGRFMIAVLVGSEEHREAHLYVICLEHEGGRAISLGTSYKKTFEEGSQCKDVFLYEDVVGVIIEDSTEMCSISAVNMKTEEEVILNREFSYKIGQIGCYVFDGHVYLVTEDHTFSHVHHCPRDALPYSNSPDPAKGSKTKFEVEGPFNWGSTDNIFTAIGVLASSVLFGVGAVSIRRLTKEVGGLGVVSTTVRFWPHNLTNDPNSPLKFGNATSLTTNLPGKILVSPSGLIYMTYVSPSGANVLVVLELEDGRLSLQLVRHIRETSSTTVHELRLPPFIDIKTISGLALDDYKGVVFLTSTTGVIFSLPYA